MQGVKKMYPAPYQPLEWNPANPFLERKGGKSIFLLTLFFSVPALQQLERCNDTGNAIMHLVTKAKKSCTAYEQPGERKAGRGRSPKKGKIVKLKELFSSKSKEFLYQELRFVLVECNGIQKSREKSN